MTRDEQAKVLKTVKVISELVGLGRVTFIPIPDLYTIAAAVVDTAIVTQPNDYYHRALLDEPKFTILARDPEFYNFVAKWAIQRQHAVMCADRPAEDQSQVNIAADLALEGAKWRRENNGKWRSAHGTDPTWGGDPSLAQKD